MPGLRHDQIRTTSSLVYLSLMIFSVVIAGKFAKCTLPFEIPIISSLAAKSPGTSSRQSLWMERCARYRDSDGPSTTPLAVVDAEIMLGIKMFLPSTSTTRRLEVRKRRVGARVDRSSSTFTTGRFEDCEGRDAFFAGLDECGVSSERCFICRERTVGERG